MEKSGIGGIMSKRYVVILDDKQEDFVKLYLSVSNLRQGHTKNMYPGLIAKNFINAMMKRRPQFEAMYEKKFGKVYDGEYIGG